MEVRDRQFYPWEKEGQSTGGEKTAQGVTMRMENMKLCAHRTAGHTMAAPLGLRARTKGAVAAQRWLCFGAGFGSASVQLATNLRFASLD